MAFRYLMLFAYLLALALGALVEDRARVLGARFPGSAP